MSKVSPFSDQVDTIHWVKIENVEANKYNPNRVAPPGMKLLEVSITEDNLRNQSSYYDESANNTSLWKDFTGIS